MHILPFDRKGGGGGAGENENGVTGSEVVGGRDGFGEDNVEVCVCACLLMCAC